MSDSWASRSTIFPLPSSPHCAPTTTVEGTLRSLPDRTAARFRGGCKELLRWLSSWRRSPRRRGREDVAGELERAAADARRDLRLPRLAYRRHHALVVR